LEVVDSLRRDTALTEPLRRQALTLANQAMEDPDRLNADSWAVACRPDAELAAYRLALRQAESASQLIPQSGLFLITLGVAQYRVGRYGEAADTLTKAEESRQNLPTGPRFTDLTFLALSRHRLGQTVEARAALGRLRELVKRPEQVNSAQAQAFLREAEAIELDLVFPADPFAH
jgi:eukaryotic-like serine/threonine-protein kinase